MLRYPNVFYYLSCNTVELSEDFIREFRDKVCWINISKYQKLSEDFIREFKDYVDWINISKYQKLSESFIREFKHKVYWNYISEYQNLSEGFVREFILKKFDLHEVIKYQRLSDDFFKDYKLDKPHSEFNWLYLPNSDKIYHLKRFNYKIIDDVIYAYKSVRNSRHSHFNFQHLFNIGEVHEDHCDFNINRQCSFGLHAWTFRKLCLSFTKIIEVSIHLDDLGTVGDQGQLRAQKLKVLT